MLIFTRFILDGPKARGFTFSVHEIFKDRTSFYYNTQVNSAIVFVAMKLFTESSTGRC